MTRQHCEAQPAGGRPHRRSRNREADDRRAAQHTQQAHIAHVRAQYRNRLDQRKDAQ